MISLQLIADNMEFIRVITYEKSDVTVYRQLSRHMTSKQRRINVDATP